MTRRIAFTAFTALIYALCGPSRLAGQETEAATWDFVVTDDRSQPVPGVEVTVSPSSQTEPMKGLTDPQGRFSCQVPAGYGWAQINPPRESGLTVYRIDGQRVAQFPLPNNDWYLRFALAASQRFEPGSVQTTAVMLKRGRASVAGRVLDPQGNPLVHAKVSVSDRFGLDWTVLTAEDGTYRLSGLLAANRYGLKVTPPEGTNFIPTKAPIGQYAGGEVNLVEGEVTTHDFNLALGGAIVGQISDDEGKPVFGATVYAGRHPLATQEGPVTQEIQAYFVGGRWFTWPGSAPVESRYPVSDERGRYAVRGLSRDTYSLSVWPPADTDLASLEATTGLEVIPGQEVLCDVCLPAGAHLSGTVLDPDGMPVEGATVSAYPRFSPAAKYYRTRSQTSREGRFQIAHLPTGCYRVVVGPPPGSHLCEEWFEDIVMVSGLSHGIDLQLHRRWDFTGRLGGKVTDENGAPVAGVRLRIERRREAVPPQTLTTTTNEQGEYRVDGLMASPNPRTDKGEEHYCWVEFIPPTVPPLYVLQPEGSQRFWAVSGQEKRMDFVLGQGYALQGTVRDEEGAPVVGARVRSYVWDGRQVSARGGAKTDEQGTFCLVLKGGDENLTMEVWPPWEANLLPAHLGTVDFSNSRLIERHGVLAKGGSMEGVLREADGQPVEDFVVSTSISLPEELHVGYSKRPSAVTDEQGRFRIVGLPTRTYQVQAKIADHFRFRSQTGGEQVPVRQGEVTPVEIVLR